SSTARRKYCSARPKLAARNCFLPRLRSSFGSLPSRPLGTASGCRSLPGSGLTLPVTTGSAAGGGTTLAGVAGFCWNSSLSFDGKLGAGGTVAVVSTCGGVSVAGGALPVVSVFDCNRSPSLVDVSQPFSHNRHATVATTTRPALAPIGAPPRPASRRSQPAEANAHDAPVRP